MILRLTAENFRSYQKLSYKIETAGLVAVEGIYEGEGDRSNGAGKSTFLPDALAWVIYGETTEGIREVCYNGAESCRVELELPFVTIARSQKADGTSNEITIDGGPRTLADSKAYLAQVFPPKEIFCSTLILGQGVAERLSSWTPGNRAQQLSELLGLERWKQARSTLAQERRKRTGELQQLQGSANTLRNQLTQLKATQAQVRRPRATIVAEMTTAQQQEQARSQQLGAANSKVQGESTRIGQAMANKNNTERQIAQQRSSLQSMTACPTCKRPYSKQAIESAQKTAANAIKKLTAENTECARVIASSTLADLKAVSDKLLAEIQHYRMQLQQLTGELAQVDAATEQVTSIELQLAQVEAAVAQTTGEVAELDLLDAAFAEIPIRKMGSVLDAVNTKLVEMCNDVWESEFLAQLCTDRELKKGTTKAEINLLVQSRAGQYKKSSVGQRRKIDLSIQAALRDVLMGTWPNPVPILVCDDVVDVLDPWAKRRLYKNYLLPTAQGSAVFVMSPQGEYPVPVRRKIVVNYTESQGSWIGAYNEPEPTKPMVVFNGA
jgi:DNA repair exonuclease SbcCD ATPase subunit